MKNTIMAITAALALVLSIGCGPSAEQVEQDKTANFAINKIHDDLEQCQGSHKGWAAAKEMDIDCFDAYDAQMRVWARLFPKQAHELAEQLKQAERDAYKQQMKSAK